MPSIRINEEYAVTYRIVASDLDSDYRMTMRSVLAYVQDTVASYLCTKGRAQFDLDQMHTLMVITEFDASFTAEKPVWRDAICVKVWVSEVSALKLYFDYAIYTAQGEECVSGSSCWAYLDTQADMRPRKVSEVIGVENVEEQIRHARLNYAAPAEEAPILTKRFVTSVVDMDFNHHINNRSYFQYAYAGAPQDFSEQYTLIKTQVRFVRQCHVGDALNCVYHALPSAITDGVSAICRMTNDEGAEVCSVVFGFAPRTTTSKDMIARVTR